MRIEYPKAALVEAGKETGTVKIDKGLLVRVTPSKTEPGEIALPDAGAIYSVRMRHYREFEGKGIYLPNIYNWVIVRDSGDELCLVPLKKEE